MQKKFEGVGDYYGGYLGFVLTDSAYILALFAVVIRDVAAPLTYVEEVFVRLLKQAVPQ